MQLIEDFREVATVTPGLSDQLDGEIESEKRKTSDSEDVFRSAKDVIDLDRPGYGDQLRILRARISMLSEDSKYGTIIISASRDRYPIPAVYCYLPPFFITGIEAREKAAGILNSTDCYLENLVFLHPGKLFYRFVHGADQVLINCKTLEVIDDPDDFAMRVIDEIHGAMDTMTPEKLEERSRDITEAWSKLSTQAD
ncbi:MAG: hypothetical protein JSV33_00260 [bacterium]|nr:MAG: hypothetical protein JSV33_00260 [bacterium]